MNYLPNSFIFFLKKSKLYNLLKFIYKKIFEKILPLELKTIENYIIQKLVKTENGLIIDIGAHKGDKTKVFLKFFPKDDYVLFEPFDEYYQIIKNKFKNKDNIKVYKKGVSNYNGSGNFYTSKNIKYSESFSLKKQKFLEISDQIEIISLDNFHFNNNIKLIKLDTEGNEPEILEGATNVIKKYRPTILVETSHITHEKIVEIFNNLEYSLLIYEYHIIKDEKIDYRNLGDLTKNDEINIVSSNRFQKILYQAKFMKKNIQLLTNSLALPDEKKELIKIKIETLNLN